MRKNPERRPLKVLFLCALMLLVSVIAAPPAAAVEGCKTTDSPDDAGTDIKCWTDDGDEWSANGWGTFFSYDEILQACDLEADGMRVVARLRWWVNGEPQQARVIDTAGGAFCSVWDERDIAEYTLIHVQVCEQAQAGYPLVDCSGGEVESWQYGRS